MAFSLKTENADPKQQAPIFRVRSTHASPGGYAGQETHTRHFSCRPENAYRGLRVENLGRRFYSPALGRWTSRDPLADEAFLIVYTSTQDDMARDRLRHETLGNIFLFVRNYAVGAIDPQGLISIPGLDQIIQDADARRGRGPWSLSAQHCWAACRIGMIAPAWGEIAAIIADIPELYDLNSDWARDIAAQHFGAKCAWALWLGPGMVFPSKACDCCCLTW